MSDITISKVPQPVWSTISIPASSQNYGTQYELFKDVRGGTVKLTDTNIRTSGRSPYPMIAIYGINVEIYQDGNYGQLPGLDLNAALHNLSLLFSKETIKRTWTMLSDIPGGNDVAGSVATGVATTTILNVNNGSPTLSNYYPLKNVETIVGNDTLSGIIKVENAWTPATALKVRVTLIAYAAQAAGVSSGN
jgi:hypothetical protein